MFNLRISEIKLGVKVFRNTTVARFHCSFKILSASFKITLLDYHNAAFYAMLKITGPASSALVGCPYLIDAVTFPAIAAGHVITIPQRQRNTDREHTPEY